VTNLIRIKTFRKNRGKGGIPDRVTTIALKEWVGEEGELVKLDKEPNKHRML